MKIALIGYGKMGREIEKIAVQRNHSIDIIIDIDNIEDIKSEKFKSCDVAIEFSIPSAVLKNIYSCFEAGVPMVTGTTGWNDHYGEINDLCKEGGHALFHASNFSIGVNLFFAINEFTANLFNNFPEYDVKMSESHHIHKLDAPSGTAISLAEILMNKLERKKSWSLDEKTDENIQIEAIREGEITGIHEISYESDMDFIELKHHAKTRKGFALGAVLAAEFIYNKTGIFTMRDLLGI
jgi:4-hydroxy-tetrahydrodipicolinate reductase